MTHATSKSKHPVVVDQFLDLLEKRTVDAFHKRLILAARKANPNSAVEAEFKKIVEELCDET
jgi:hypothetical protein